ncbi:MAG TPA: SRPBCC family protein [Mycobacterium sp.]|nr:SRPBCC family protein [Mycobacterium sp.]HTX94841.1 SRPBCC family protein [Mycobacterium sp.]
MPSSNGYGTSPSVIVSVLGLIGYDALIRPALLDWGATDAEQRMPLAGDEIVDDVMSHHTRAVTINAPAAAIWPWLVQMGDHRAGFYSYDWVERYLFPGTVHYVDGRNSATRIHPELQNIAIGERINTGSFGPTQIGSPVTVLEPDRALVIGTWAFVLLPLDESHTRLLVRERDAGWLRLLAPRRFGLLRALGAVIDYAIGEPLHFVMVRKMMLGIKQRAEATWSVR